MFTATAKWNRCIEFVLPNAYTVTVKVLGSEDGAAAATGELLAALAKAGIKPVTPPAVDPDDTTKRQNSVPRWVLRNKKTKKIVDIGATLKSGERDGIIYTVTDFEKPRHENSSGRVYVRPNRDSYGRIARKSLPSQSYFPHVFGLEVVEVR